MTETQWLAATDPRPLLRFVSSPGELRYFAVACVRELGFGEWCSALGGVSDLWPTVLDTADRLAAGSAIPDEVHTLARELNRRVCGMTLLGDRDQSGYEMQCRLLADPFTRQDAEAASYWCVYGRSLAGVSVELSDLERSMVWDAIRPSERQSGLLTLHATFARDIIGNPFSPIALDPSWLTPDVMALARGIYDDRAFDRLPILADALMDAGCDQDDILSHCRSDGPHCRGCWAVDLVLGRSALVRAGCLRLVGMTEGFEGRVWMFAEPFEIGRGSGRLLADEPGDSISRLHAAVFTDGAGWWVADQGSTNGSWLNGTRLGEQPAGPLREGDILQFAKVAFRVESIAPASR